MVSMIIAHDINCKFIKMLWNDFVIDFGNLSKSFIYFDRCIHNEAQVLF